MEVEIRPQPALRVAAVRHVGRYTEIGRAFERVGQIAGGADLFGWPGAQMVALYHDDPRTTPESALTSDAGVTVRPGTQLPEGLAERQLPAGSYACTVHVGPYELLGDAWGHFTREWLPASGRRRSTIGPSYEVYLNNPMTTPRDELRTELRIPVD